MCVCVCVCVFVCLFVCVFFWGEKGRGEHPIYARTQGELYIFKFEKKIDLRVGLETRPHEYLSDALPTELSVDQMSRASDF